MGRRLRWQWLLGFSTILVAMGTGLAVTQAGIAQPHLAPRSPCPTDVETLSDQLLQDLPNYANRVNTQVGISNNYVIVASRPEFKPLPLGPGQRATVLDTTTVPGDPEQIFFTTLERSYQDGKPVQLQLYHWLFLTQTESGWRLALMYSMVGPYPPGRPPSPPQESSNGSVAAAIRTWLRDCRLTSAT